MQIDDVTNVIKHSKLWGGQFLCFFQTSFFLIKCAHNFFSKLERIIILMIKRAKELKLANFIFATHLNIFGSNVFLALKVMNFENVFLAKKKSFL
jgi:hypothetical protein